MNNFKSYSPNYSITEISMTSDNIASSSKDNIIDKIYYFFNNKKNNKYCWILFILLIILIIIMYNNQKKKKYDKLIHRKIHKKIQKHIYNDDDMNSINLSKNNILNIKINKIKHKYIKLYQKIKYMDNHYYNIIINKLDNEHLSKKQLINLINDNHNNKIIIKLLLCKIKLIKYNKIINNKLKHSSHTHGVNNSNHLPKTHRSFRENNNLHHSVNSNSVNKSKNLQKSNKIHIENSNKSQNNLQKTDSHTQLQQNSNNQQNLQVNGFNFNGNKETFGSEEFSTVQPYQNNYMYDNYSEHN